ncbi:MAG: putative bifunctional diguanylate cyclase/phosphodiesterase [Peptococcales bacterium]|jgi:polar amino acid transport system substrate-binding protein
MLILLLVSLLIMLIIFLLLNIRKQRKIKMQLNASLQELASAHEKMNYLAHYDPLTDLPNKLKFYEELNVALSRARHENHLVALICLDLDNFKVVNESLGHFYGDQLLIQLARKLTETVSSQNIIARLGGDEFFIIQKGITQPQEVIDLAEKIMALFSEPFLLGGREFLITCSVGITVYPFDGEESTDLLKKADNALYSAKRLGKNNYQFYDQVMNLEILERIEMENSLRKALEKEEFIVYYQPILQTKTEKIIGMEALVRWEHPEKGLLSPGEFIPVLEKTGLIVPVGNWVLKKACEEVRQWHQQGFTDLVLSVNLSPAQLKDENVLTITKIIEESGINPNHIKLEVTESIAIDNIRYVSAILEKLESLGVGISLDDFGTGYSSLNYLRKLPITNLKIDKSFINKINLGYEEDEIAIAVINLAHAMGLTVTAEGVETSEQLSFLKEQKCDFVQGYFFSKPISAAKFKEILKKSTIENFS